MGRDERGYVETTTRARGDVLAAVFVVGLVIVVIAVVALARIVLAPSGQQTYRISQTAET